jgi:hypothetical protein
MRSLLIALVAAFVTPASVGAQCAFDRPFASSSYTGVFKSSLVRAFVHCNNPGGNPANATTITGTVPTCYPVEDFHERAGSPTGGWEFHSGTSYGTVAIKRAKGVGPNLGFPPPRLDAVVEVKLYHIGSSDGPGFAGGTGSVQVLLRVTTQDYSSTDMTVIDFPFAFPIALSSGNGSGFATKKVGDALFDLDNPRFTDCTSFEVLAVTVHDPNGTRFAVPGVRH